MTIYTSRETEKVSSSMSEFVFVPQSDCPPSHPDTADFMNSTEFAHVSPDKQSYKPPNIKSLCCMWLKVTVSMF